jgi:hypothetical protein
VAPLDNIRKAFCKVIGILLEGFYYFACAWNQPSHFSKGHSLLFKILGSLRACRMTSLLEKRNDAEAIELSSNSSSAEISSLERALLWKLDLHILPLLFLAYIITFIDRANIGNVKIEGMLTDLDMVGNDYNMALNLYAVPFILLELPSSLALRRYRPGKYIAFIMFGWGEFQIPWQCDGMLMG